MAMRMGTEKKSQVYWLIGWGVVLVGALVYFLNYTFGGPPSTPRPAAVIQPAPAHPAPASARTVAAAPPAAQEALKLSNDGIDPTLHLDKLALTEDVEYLGTGRNIFSAESAQPVIEQPIKSVRGDQATANPVAAVRVAPAPPAIDLKYFGYSQAKNKTLQAFFVHGDDIFVARTGEIVDRRYKVGVISPNSAQVTDLSYNNTQSLPFQPN
jgi:hypothetical protein